MDLADLSHPGRLLWLLALPVLLWLARPVRPRRIVATPHLVQWLRARARLGRRPVRFPWRRFVLLGIAFAAAVLAFAGATRGGRAGPTTLVVLLDTSASMGAGGDGSPWRQGLARLRTALGALPGHVEVRLALCGAALDVRQGERHELLAALPEHPAGENRVDLAALAARLAADFDRVSVWSITDGCGAARPPVDGALTLLGGAVPNAAITALDVEDAWPLPDVTFTVEARSFLAEPATLRLEVQGGVEPATADVPLAPGRVERVALRLRRTSGGRTSVRLTAPADGLAADDVVSALLPAPAATDIALLADGEVPAVVRAAAAALAGETGGRVVEGERAEPAAFLLVEGGILPDGVAGRRMLTFGTRRGTAPLLGDDVVARPTVIDWDRADPLTRGLDLSELDVGACLRADFLGAGRPLISAAHGPLLVVDEREDGASVHAAFRLVDANLALLPAFPQLLRRSFARAFGQRVVPVLDAANLVSAVESDLRPPAGARPADRALPTFGAPGQSLAVPLLALALAALVLRLYA